MAKKSLEERIQLVEDYIEIQNLMGKHEYLHSAAMNAEDAELFAKKHPDVAIEIADWGVYEGNEGVERFHVKRLQSVIEDPTGGLFIHTLSTPVIEVAGDGKTAKAVWISPGIETMRDAKGKLTAYWVWAKYGVDFIKEDGKWRFWHLHLYSLFGCPYDKSWVEAPEHPSSELLDVPDDEKPDRPTTYHKEYRPNRAPEYVPAPPEPYETWDESTSYIKK